MVTVNLLDNFYEAEYMTICDELGVVFYWFGEKAANGSEIFVYSYTGELVTRLETIPAKWRVMRTIKAYIMQELGIDPDDPPERLY